MKNIYKTLNGSLLLTALALPVAVSAQTLQAHWTMNEDPVLNNTSISDSSGNGYSGTFVSGPDTTVNHAFSTGVPTGLGTAINFMNDAPDANTDGDHIGFAAGIVPSGTSARSFSTWFNVASITTTTHDNRLFAYGGSPAGTFFAVTFEGTTDITGLRFRYGGSEVYQPAGGGTLANFGDWLNLTVVVPDGALASGVKFYLDGTPLSIAAPQSTVINTTDSTFGIGARVGTAGEYNRGFDGQIADFQVYNGELSAADAQYLYNNPGSVISPVPEPATATLLVLGGVGFCLLFRRRVAGCSK